MGKAEVGTPKYIANKIKAKGLQKLRWYCQMCEKQCRDENGFKCHAMSESHQRQLLLFADNPGKYMDEFSRQFKREFLYLLKRQFGTKRVLANKVYQEYISDRQHLHMNATQWETLTDFVKWLGREGKCIADETEKGWFITYIDRDPEVIQQQEQQAKKEKMAKDDEEEMMDFIEKQIKRDKTKNIPESKPTELMKNENEKLTIKLNINVPMKSEKANLLQASEVFPGTSKEKSVSVFKKPKNTVEKRPLSNLEAIRREEEERKKRKKERVMEEESKQHSQNEAWLTEGIVVKVITSSLGEEFNNKKGLVRKVIDKYGAIVKILDTNKKIKVDQSHLQTVIPNIGKELKILTGRYAGVEAELLSVNIDRYSVDVEIKRPPEFTGKILKDLEYEVVSKIFDGKC